MNTLAPLRRKECYAAVEVIYLTPPRLEYGCDVRVSADPSREKYRGFRYLTLSFVAVIVIKMCQALPAQSLVFEKDY